MRRNQVRNCGLAAAVMALSAVIPAPAHALGSQTEPAPATFTAQGPRVKGLTVAVQMTKDAPSPTRSFSGPTSMLADPANPRIILAASADLRSRICYLLRSNDAGHSWHIVGPNLPALKAYPYCETAFNAGSGQAAIAWGRNHTLYYALGGYGDHEGGNDGVNSVLLARSTDYGNTWTTVVVDNNRGKSGPSAPADSGVNGLAVDTSGPKDVVYVGIEQYFPNAPMDSPLQQGTVLVATSTDGGATFGSPVNINTFSHLTQDIGGKTVPLFMMAGFGGPWFSVHHGVLLAVAGAQPLYSTNLFGVGGTALPQLLARSTDQGATWSFSALGPPIYQGTGPQTGIGWTPLGGAHGTFLATYASTPATANSSGTATIVLQRSTDEGQTWTPPVTISDDDPAQQLTSFYPQLGVAPNGRVDVVWEDNRDQHDNHFQVRYSYSSDGGVNWTHSAQINDHPINFGLGVSFNSDIRQPPGVASANQYAAFGWADTRLGNETTQTQDDFGAAAQFASLPAAKSTLLPVLATICAAIAAAGLIFLLTLLLRRRRSTLT